MVNKTVSTCRDASHRRRLSRRGRGRIRAALLDTLEARRFEGELRLTEIALENRERAEAALSEDARLVRRLLRDGALDRWPDGSVRHRSGQVAAERMDCRVYALGGDLLLEFTSQARRGHRRHLLARADGAYRLDVGRPDLLDVRASGRGANKYAGAAVTILANRAYEMDTRGAAE